VNYPFNVILTKFLTLAVACSWDSISAGVSPRKSTQFVMNQD